MNILYVADHRFIPVAPSSDFYQDKLLSSIISGPLAHATNKISGV